MTPQRRATACLLLAAAAENLRQLQHMLSVARDIHTTTAGEPDWLMNLRRAQEALGRALAEVSKNAQL
jgi:hypothetical protein